jgi:hypothetical protein
VKTKLKVDLINVLSSPRFHSIEALVGWLLFSGIKIAPVRPVLLSLRFLQQVNQMYFFEY